MIYIRNRYFLLFDLICLVVIPFLALFLRVDMEALAERYRLALIAYTGVAVALKVPVFYGFGLYRRYWRYASVDELFIIVAAVGVATAILAAGLLGAHILTQEPTAWLPRSVPFIDGMLTLLAVGGTRFSLRVLETAHRWRTVRDPGAGPADDKKRVLVMGAGDAGALIVREMRRNTHINLEPVGYVDDDPRKQSAIIHGVPVLGMRDKLPELVAAYDIQLVVIAMPTAPGVVIREIVKLCEAARVPSQTMPGIYEILSGQVKTSQLRNVEIEDLLRRKPVEIALAAVARLLANRRILVTGAGGSIGSELCRQVVRCGPASLILVGHGENSLFAIERELHRLAPDMPLEVVVADIRDERRLSAVFERLRPQVVFHAAAHKHVPLMEANPEDAVTNNIGGTRALVALCARAGVERFLLISSDKAVNPANIMGATKRVAEMIVQVAARETGRPYVAVRFGNVLGSRGSVVPTFREQIARGGPVTVTHPDVTRYFMTIPEAVQLVLQAVTLEPPSRQGGVFVLDMGEPIRITDLARDLITLSGLEPGQDIEIVYTGLRPGEKLYEELFLNDEDYRRTEHEKIMAARNSWPAGLGDDRARLDDYLEQLLRAAQNGQPDEIRALLHALIPAFPAVPEAGRPPA